MNTSNLKNNKYFFGRYAESKKYRGWLCGSFFDKNHPGNTDQLEIKYAEHKKGDIEKPHYHEKMIELLIFLEGKAKFNINGKNIIIKKGDFIFIGANNIISGEFIEPSKIFAIHTPSIPDDEIIIK